MGLFGNYHIGKRTPLLYYYVDRSRIVRLQCAEDLIVYQKAYALSMRIFEISKRFPVEERYAMTGQMRRSSRSVCLNLKEAWAKRRYEAHFISKLTDCDGENDETKTSLDFAKDCGYISEQEHKQLSAGLSEVGRMLGSMIRESEKFVIHET
jgi:four helix bundle protein